MTFKIPGPIRSFAYGNPLPVISSKAYRDPAEGKSYMPIELDWAGDGATLDINIAGTSAQPFTQIVMVDCDNSQSSADLTLYFPDSTYTLVVPAYSGGLFPVFTSGLRFYAAAPSALATDISYLRLLNYRQEPIANPPPQFHNVANNSLIDPTAPGTTALIAAGVSGTLVGYSLSISVAAGAVASGQMLIQVKDHASGAIIDAFYVLAPTNGFTNGSLIVQGCAYRFASGVDIVTTQQGTNWAAGKLSASLRYRSP